MRKLIHYTENNLRTLLAILLLVSGIMNNISAQESNEINCLECHDDLNSAQIVHAPVEDDCTNCHNPTGIAHPDGDGKWFEFTSEMPSLCYQCHEIALPEGSTMHAPVEMGECTSCHDAHKSEFSYLLKEKKPELCFECHDGIKEQIETKHPHAPAVDDCSNCHNSHGGKAALLTEEMPTLCLNCHEMTGKAHEHQPAKDGECLTCHSPHGSDNEKMLTTETSGELCMMCHDVTASEGETLHAAVEMGECLQCHDAHQSDNSVLIKHDNPRYCLECHSDLQIADEMSNQHPPYQEDCANCHTAHKSTQPKLLTDEANNICFMCHDNVQEQLKHKPVVHKVLYEKSSCVKCHSPHASNQTSLLKNSDKKLCLDCHNKEIKTDYGIIKDLNAHISGKESIHAPIEEGCLTCHGPHAEEFPFLLNGLFPPVNYVPANIRNFQLCFNCHNEELMTVKYNTEATNFRDGDLNLHYVHLEGKKARNCNLCHDVHASENKYLIKKYVWFGQWKMPFEYELNKKGGSCFTGCHEKRSYVK